VQQDLRGLFERALDDEPVPPPGDPVGQAMAHGRRIRRRRGVLVGGSAARAVVAVLATLNVVLAPAEPPPPVSAAMPALVTAPCAEKVKRAEQVAIFLNHDITDAQRLNLDAALRADPIVRNLRFESREQAYVKFAELWRDSPDFVASVGPEALPESFRVDLAEPAGYPRFAARVKKQAGVDQIVGMPCSGAGQ